MVNIAHASITSTSKCCEEILLCVGPLSHSDILHDISAASEAVMTSQQPLEQRIARLWRDSRTNNNRDSTSPLVVFELLSYEQFMVKTIFFLIMVCSEMPRRKFRKRTLILCSEPLMYHHYVILWLLLHVFSQKSCHYVILH